MYEVAFTGESSRETIMDANSSLNEQKSEELKLKANDAFKGMLGFDPLHVLILYYVRTACVFEL